MHLVFQAKIAVVAVQEDDKNKNRRNVNTKIFHCAMSICLIRNLEQKGTLNREPIEENFDDLADSSGKRGNKPETKEHSEALRSA